MRAELSGEPFRIMSTDDGQLVHANGGMIEDLHGTQAFGHRNPVITAAVRDFLDSDAASWYPARVNPFAGRVARLLCERSGYSNVFFASSGSEAVEAALKLARAVTRRPRILSLEGAYHGCTFGSCALMSRGIFRDPFEPHLPGVEAVPFGDIGALRSAFAEGQIAAVVVEPIQVEGGVRPLPTDYRDDLLRLAEQHDALIIADEVQTGMGRTGRFLASSAWPRRPDVVLLGKHLGGGLAPISAMLTRMELFEKAYGATYESAEAHNSTFSGNALVCVAALAALGLLTDELIAEVGHTRERFRAELSAAMSDLPLFAEVRGDGLVVGIALHPLQHPWLSFEHFGLPALAEQPTTGLLLCHRLYRRGYFCFVCGHRWSVLRLQPRFNIEPERLSEFVRACREELAFLCELA
jgi:acetylornithine/succinyldiaminopimelate/putrescine aminotransferase